MSTPALEAYIAEINPKFKKKMENKILANENKSCSQILIKLSRKKKKNYNESQNVTKYKILIPWLQIN